MRRMSRCFIKFSISGLEEPNIYHDSVVFYKKWGFYLEGCLTCEELVRILTGDDGGSHPVKKPLKAHPKLSQPDSRV